LDSREREALRLRFIEQWEYHEIAAAQSIHKRQLREAESTDPPGRGGLSRSSDEAG
jgi:DNA-directed RNA polymerase specialized sigma24 family protein